jgi:putative transcriptional regulator
VDKDMNVKNNLRVLMAKHKMNIKDVHEKTGLSRTTISKLYNEESTTIAFETIYKLCLLFNCDVNDLLYLENEPIETPTSTKDFNEIDDTVLIGTLTACLDTNVLNQLALTRPATSKTYTQSKGRSSRLHDSSEDVTYSITNEEGKTITFSKQRLVDAIKQYFQKVTITQDDLEKLANLQQQDINRIFDFYKKTV